MAVSIARLGTTGVQFIAQPIGEDSHLLSAVAEPGTRPGVVLGAVLLTVPVLLLLDQAVRLGSTGQQWRYAALATAGATRQDLRRWASIEVALPAFAGAVMGLGVWRSCARSLVTAWPGPPGHSCRRRSGLGRGRSWSSRR